MSCIVAAFCVATAVASSAQTVTTLFTFDGQNTYLPVALTQGTDGKLYGTGAAGGRNGERNPTPGDGTAFAMTTDGTLTSLYSFCSLTKCEDGRDPQAGLLLAANGDLYGTTAVGGAGSNCFNSGEGCGSLFEFSSVGQPTLRHQFCSLPKCADGSFPEEGMVQGFNGSIYGTTSSGGSFNGPCLPVVEPFSRSLMTAPSLLFMHFVNPAQTAGMLQNPRPCWCWAAMATFRAELTVAQRPPAHCSS